MEGFIRYRRGKMLGKGGFAMVYQFTDLVTGDELAAKVISKKTLDNKMTRSKLETEIKIHRSLSHPNIVKFKYHFEDEANIYIMMELCRGSTVADVVKKRGRIESKDAARILRQLVSALAYMHERRIIHRDLKLANLMISTSGNLRLGDFGLACQVRRADERRMTVCGTPNYIAPEVLRGKRGTGHSFQADIWSLGAVLYAMLVGKPPFETKSVEETYERIKRNDYTFPVSRPICPLGASLIQDMLRTEQARRPSLHFIKHHDFVLAHTGASPAAPHRRADPDPLRQAPPAMTKRVGAMDPETLRLLQRERAGLGAEAAELRPLKDVTNTHAGASRRPGSAPVEAGAWYGREVARHPPSPPRPAAVQKRSPLKETRALRAKPRAAAGLAAEFAAVEASASAASAAAVGGAGPAARKPRPGPSIVKWLDFSAKYGVCYLISDGSVGCLFNDMTKLLLCKGHDHMLYTPDTSGGAHAAASEVLPAVEPPPERLKKKVNLLFHFQKQLGGEFRPSGASAPPHPKRSVFVKRWVKTKYSSVFRLSDRTIQVIFRDKSAIHLCTQEKYIIYFDKFGGSDSYFFDALPSDPPMLRRLKYTKEILHDLLTGSRR